MRILIFGNGWIGRRLRDLLNTLPLCFPFVSDIKLSLIDITDSDAVASEIDSYSPNVVINTAGATGKKYKSDISWCDEHKNETNLSNIAGPIILASETFKRGVTLVHISTACVFEGVGWKKSFSEDYDTSVPVRYYSYSKAAADEILRRLSHTLILRIHMPFDSISNPGNLIDKVLRYERLAGGAHSITSLPHFSSTLIDLLRNKMRGIFNVVCAGPISLIELGNICREVLGVDKKWDEVAEIENLAILNTAAITLSVDKMRKWGFLVPNTRDELRRILEGYREYMVGD